MQFSGNKYECTMDQELQTTCHPPEAATVGVLCSDAYCCNDAMAAILKAVFFKPIYPPDLGG